MKALIRNKGETVTETMDIGGIDWKTGWPLTDPKWAGGAYRLVNNYVAPETPDDDASYDIVTEDYTVTDDTVIIDGKEYTKAELRALLGE